MPEKIVYFEEFCRDCVYYNDPETCDPCNECLTYPANEDSHKPVNFKEED